MKIKYISLTFIFMILNTFYLYSQIEIESQIKAITLSKILSKKPSIKLCVFNKNDTVLHIKKMSKVIYDESDILKGIVEDSAFNSYSLLKFKVTDINNFDIFFINIPGYSKHYENIHISQIPTRRIIVPINTSVCRRVLLDLSNIEYKVRENSDYFIRIYMLHNRDTIFLKTPILLKVKALLP